MTAWSFKEKAFRLSKFNYWFACLFVCFCLFAFVFVFWVCVCVVVVFSEGPFKRIDYVSIVFSLFENEDFCTARRFVRKLTLEKDFKTHSKQRFYQKRCP